MRRRTETTLVRAPTAARQARRFVDRVCADWGIPATAHDAVAVATELVENTLQHTTCAPSLRLELRRGMLTIAVSDDDPRRAVMRESAAGEPPGLGLLLVAQTARAWGCTPTTAGKATWAVLQTAQVTFPAVR